MEALLSCCCCMRRSPDRDLNMPYYHLDKTEIYSDMLADCFDIHLQWVNHPESGICEICVASLRDASEFKLQVQSCQAAMQRLQGELLVKDESKIKLELLEISDDEVTDDFDSSESRIESNDSKKLLVNFIQPQVIIKVESDSKFEADESVPCLSTPHHDPRRASRVNSMVVRTDLKYSCEICEKLFTKKKNLIGHMKMHNNAKTHLCEVCSKVFKHKHHLIDHTRIHTGVQPYSCDTCHKKFSQQSSLIVHKRIHTGVKPYSCDICNKSFTQSSALITHKRTHGEKGFTCEVCDKEFTLKCNFAAHVRTHTGEKPYQCEICEKRFNEQSSLKRHRRIHTGETPYTCKTCDKKFKEFSSYSRHIQIHTGMKPYSCEVCNRSFGRKTHLNRHKQLHTGEKRYCCEICGKRFTEKFTLNHHKMVHSNSISTDGVLPAAPAPVGSEIAMAGTDGNDSSEKTYSHLPPAGTDENTLLIK